MKYLRYKTRDGVGELALVATILLMLAQLAFYGGISLFVGYIVFNILQHITIH